MHSVSCEKVVVVRAVRQKLDKQSTYTQRELRILHYQSQSTTAQAQLYNALCMQLHRDEVVVPFPSAPDMRAPCSWPVHAPACWSYAPPARASGCAGST